MKYTLGTTTTGSAVSQGVDCSGTHASHSEAAAVWEHSTPDTLAHQCGN